MKKIDWEKALKRFLLYVLLPLLGINEGMQLAQGDEEQPPEAYSATFPSDIEIYSDTSELKDPAAAIFRYELWVLYKVSQKVEIERKGILPDAGLTVPVYYTHHFFVSMSGYPSLTWINDRVKPPFGGEAVKRLEVKKIKHYPQLE